MKKRHWLDISEDVLLVGSGVGTVASVVAQQAVYAAAPLSILALLSVANRRRFQQVSMVEQETAIAQLDERVSRDLKLIRQQVRSSLTHDDLEQLRQSILQDSQNAIASLRKEVLKRISQLEQQGYKALQRDVKALQERTENLASSLDNVTHYLYRLPTGAKLEAVENGISELQQELRQVRGRLQTILDEPRSSLQALQDQIHHLNRRFNNLPAPFDASSLKQDVESLIKLFGDLVPRREMTRLTVNLEQLQQQQSILEQSMGPVRMAVLILRRQLDDLNLRVRHLAPNGDLLSTEPPEIAQLRQSIQSLEDRMNEFSESPPLAQLQAELQQAIATQQTIPLGLPSSSITNNIAPPSQAIRNWVYQHPELLDASALQKQLQCLAARIEGVESNLAGISGHMHESVQQQLSEINQQLQTLQPNSGYDWVFTLQNHPTLQGESIQEPSYASILQTVLAQTQHHLIVVWPWLNRERFNLALIEEFRQFLNRQGQLEIGLGHLDDWQQERQPRCFDARWTTAAADRQFLQEALQQLTQLKRDYPKQFKFKILGTDENFLICDPPREGWPGTRAFAILDIRPLTTLSSVFPDLEMGLRTTDIQVIRGLLERFNRPMLDPKDSMAYFHRAVTHHELGDRQGAIADYTQVLRINPSDDIAYNNRGLAHYESGDSQAAIADLDQALQINPLNAVSYCNRGFVSAAMGDQLGAIEDYSQAIRLNAEFATPYFYRGLSRTRLGNKLGAIEDYSEVIRIDRQAAVAYFYRGLARTKLGNAPGAIEDLQQAAVLFAQQGQPTNAQKARFTAQKVQQAIAQNHSPHTPSLVS